MQRVKKIGYCYAKVPHRAGQAMKMLAAFADAGVDLLAFSGFPLGAGKAQVDFVPVSMPALRRVAKREERVFRPALRASAVRKGDWCRRAEVGASHRASSIALFTAVGG